ncbi:MAG: restriction endonuclease subunit R [Planctomycetota bacterium]|nr:MAG: restriction endonuclease subunit R [Planctomycetota bacterium]
MARIPKKVSKRLAIKLKSFQIILKGARTRDVNEADTVRIITDMLAELFGYDKYSEITAEHSIRGTFVDLAIVIDGKLRFLIEVKAIGLDLKESHIRQAVNYGANQGVEWVILTNGIIWKVFRLSFGKPINKEIVIEFDILDLNQRNSSDIERLYTLTRDGLKKATLSKYHEQRQAMDKFTLGALLISDPILNIVRREVRKLSPRIKIKISEIKEVLKQEVLKREIVEGENAEKALKNVGKAKRKGKAGRKKRRGRRKSTKKDVDENTGTEPTPVKLELNNS